jgi:hypothetical protein
VRVNLASGRGLLAGWLIALTIPLLFDPHSIAAWSAAGLGDASRIALAAIEVAGAALFAFERVALAGFALLLASFIPAAVIHVHHDEAPWRLALYSIAALLLSLYTRRAHRPGTPRNS